MVKYKRSYNVFFNVHTVSGITITIGLFVIFLAGAFALFTGEINNWQYNERKHPFRTVLDYDRIIERVKQEGYTTKGRSFFIGYREIGDYIKVTAKALEDPKEDRPTAEKTLATGNREAVAMQLSPEDYTLIEKTSEKSDLLGHYIFQLHFFDQIPGAGLYLSGFVALFFGLSIISGIIVHWNKIVSNFFTFRIKSSIKNLWTDAHTALGVLGLPFQFMYAITGAYLGVATLLYVPILFIQYGGDIQNFRDAVNPSLKMEDFPAPTQQRDTVSINTLIYPDLEPLNPDQISSIGVFIADYQEKPGKLTLNISYTGETQFMAEAKKIIRLEDGLVLQDKSRDDNSYTYATGATIGKLHFALFGGFFMKITYFVLSIITCYTILSGVMIWLVAREKKAYANKAKFNRNVGAIFIGACMGLFPAIALFFCLAKVFPDRFGMMSNVFLLFWLAYTIYSYFIKSPFKINKYALLLAGVFGLLIPIVNGFQSGLWFWQSLGLGYPDSFFVDVGWLLLGGLSVFSAVVAKRLDSKKSKKRLEEIAHLKPVKERS
ncbi:MAG: PepSY-associated TM helix domain-containing protein [Bacteroidota bacterium]